MWFPKSPTNEQIVGSYRSGLVMGLKVGNELSAMLERDLAELLSFTITEQQIAVSLGPLSTTKYLVYPYDAMYLAYARNDGEDLARKLISELSYQTVSAQLVMNYSLRSPNSRTWCEQQGINPAWRGEPIVTLSPLYQIEVITVLGHLLGDMAHKTEGFDAPIQAAKCGNTQIHYAAYPEFRTVILLKEHPHVSSRNQNPRR